MRWNGDCSGFVGSPLLGGALASARYTLQLIKERGEFVVSAVGKSLEKEAYGVFGSVSGREGDKFEKSGVKVLGGMCVTAPVLADAAVALECELEKSVELGITSSSSGASPARES